MNILCKSTNIHIYSYTAFLFMGQAFWKENIEDRVNILGSNVLDCCLKITIANLHKSGLKMREWHFRELI